MALTLPPVGLPDRGAPRLRRFEIRSRLGEGASGVVYEAIDRETNGRIALKTLRNTDAPMIRALKHEFRTVQDLQHPNIVQLLELFEEDGRWYISMEFVAGTDFLTYVRPPTSSRLSGQRASSPVAARAHGRPRVHEFRLRSTMAQLAIGLTALHNAQKIHMDVKPANVLVTPRGRVVIVDFGVARDMIAPARAAEEGIRGTASYMAPEQVLGDEIGPAADWYAVGVMLHCALTGRLPIEGTGMEILTRKLSVVPARASSLEPDTPPDLDQLCADLLKIEPGDRPPSIAVLERLDVDPALVDLAPQSGVSFVGRRKELDALQRAYADVDAVAGRAVAVIVEGASGVGKSRLVRRFVEELASRSPPPLVLTGRCYERESVPYKGVDAALDELALYVGEASEDDLARVRPPDAELLALAFPLLADALRVAPPVTAPANPADARMRVFTAVRTLIANLAKGEPLVLAIDDLQWAGADTLGLVAELLRPPDAPRILVIATSRAEDAGAGSPTVLGDVPGDVRRVRVGGLDSGEARLLVASLVEQTGAPAGDVASILEESQGLPFFVEEIVRERARSAADGSIVRLEDAIHARVLRLDVTARRLIEAVCVAGRPTPVEVIGQAAEIAIGDVFRLTAALRGAQFVAASAVRLDDLLAPYHDRVREAVVSRLAPGDKRAWHERLARALESMPAGADPEVVTLHWQAAGDLAKAGAYAKRAAERAASALGFERAVQFYELALELGAPDAADRDALLGALADALAHAGRGADAAAIRLELAERMPATRALDLRRRAAEELLVSGHIQRGAVVLRDALGAANIWAPQSSFALIVGLLFLRLVLRLRGLAFVERATSEIDPDVLVRIDTVFSAGGGYAMTDNVRGGYFLARNLLLTLAAGDRHRVMIAVGYQAAFSATMGSKSLARTEMLVGELARLAERGATARARALSYVAPAYRDYFVGRWRSAAALLARAEDVLRDECIGAQIELNPTRILLYRTLGYLGELEQLRARVPPMLREAHRLGDVNMQRNLEGGPMPLLALAAGDADAAEALVDEAERKLQGERFHLQHYVCVVARMQIDLYRGRAPDAARRLHDAWPPLRRSLLLHVQIIRGWALEHRARASVAAAVAVRGAEGARLLRSAEGDAAEIAREPTPWCAALATMLRANIAAARGDQAVAVAEYRTASAALHAVDLALYAAAAEVRLGERLGGAEGDEARGRGERALRSRGVTDPEPFVACYAPAALTRT